MGYRSLSLTHPHAIPRVSGVEYSDGMKRLICIYTFCMLLSACSDPMPQSGQASYTWGNGNTYVGEWKDGKPNGKGTATYVGLGRYVGTFKKGKRHGRGEANYVDGRKYVGEWKDGDPWIGKEYDKDGKVIASYSGGISAADGESVDSSSSVTDALGRQVSGVIEAVRDLAASVWSGEGVIESSLPSCKDTHWFYFHNCHSATLMTDGSTYVGEWQNGRYHGYGTKTYPGGTKYIGEWKKGKQWEGTQYDEDGDVFSTYSEGVWKMVD